MEKVENFEYIYNLLGRIEYEIDLIIKLLEYNYEEKSNDSIS